MNLRDEVTWWGSCWGEWWGWLNYEVDQVMRMCDQGCLNDEVAWSGWLNEKVVWANQVTMKRGLELGPSVISDFMKRDYHCTSLPGRLLMNPDPYPGCFWIRIRIQTKIYNRKFVKIKKRHIHVRIRKPLKMDTQAPGEASRPIANSSNMKFFP